MDYISSKNLNEFMRDYKSSVSLLTKLYLIYSIIQSLRYIRDYRIVHLDLKPNNVMIFFNMLIKLIDFGQSYHPDVCLKSNLLANQNMYQGILFHTPLLKYSRRTLIFIHPKVMSSPQESSFSRCSIDPFHMIFTNRLRMWMKL